MQEDDWLSAASALADSVVETSRGAPIWLQSTLISGLTFVFALPAWQVRR